MNIDRRDYGKGTWIEQSYPWGEYVKAKAWCSDNKLRIVTKFAEPDTFFSVPCSVRVGGTWVRGFITIDRGYVRFDSYEYCKNGDLLPEWNGEPETINVEVRHGAWR